MKLIRVGFAVAIVSSFVSLSAFASSPTERASANAVTPRHECPESSAFGPVGHECPEKR